INLDLCFPELDAAARNRLAREHFAALGIAVFEIALCWWGSERKLRKLVRIEGLEQLDAALAKGKGALLLSAHFTTLEIGGRLLALFRPFHLMYRPNRTELLEVIISSSRRKHFEKVIPRDDVRAMIRSLKDNHPVWYAPDQGYRGKHSAMLPFFNVPAPTNTATSRIAAFTGSPVLPFMVERLPESEGYLLRINAPLENFPSGDPEDDGARASMRSSKPKRGAYPSSTCGATTASRRTTGTGPETEPPASGFFTFTFRAPDMITVTMLTRNSSRFVEKALAALAGFDEILVLDNGSTDDTMEIARRFPNVRLIEHEFIGFGPLKNLAADAARNDWILNVDSDEIMTPELAAELREMALDASRVYTVPIVNHYRGKPIRGCGW